MRGSSPLAQGKPQVTVEGTVEEGLIPADAGKTRCTPRPRRLCPAHPRSRGENDCWIGGCQWSKAHPRSRGENIAGPRTGKTTAGSSPLTRGKRLGEDHVAGVEGLIPAHAGKTRNAVPGRRPNRAHPRSRGENGQPVTTLPRYVGSSPLTRGKLDRRRRRPVRPRLIPAHAGKTTGGEWSHGRVRAHPHSRGENGFVGQYCQPSRGSSPLTRGKTMTSGAWSNTSPAHPHSRGKTNLP